jgi:hypothetical protein
MIFGKDTPSRTSKWVGLFKLGRLLVTQSAIQSIICASFTVGRPKRRMAWDASVSNAVGDSSPTICGFFPRTSRALCKRV